MWIFCSLAQGFQEASSEGSPHTVDSHLTGDSLNWSPLLRNMQNESHLTGDSLKWSPAGWRWRLRRAPCAFGPRSGPIFLKGSVSLNW